MDRVFAGLTGNLVGGILSDGENTDEDDLVSANYTTDRYLHRFVEPGTFVFWTGIVIGYFQLGCFFGPTFSTVQELVPENIKATVVSFYILTLNLIGLTIGSLGEYVQIY